MALINKEIAHVWNHARNSELRLKIHDGKPSASRVELCFQVKESRKDLDALLDKAGEVFRGASFIEYGELVFVMKEEKLSRVKVIWTCKPTDPDLGGH